MNLYLYSFESAGEPFGTWYTQSYTEAKKHAEKHRLTIIENVYEWQEGILVESFEAVQLLPCVCGQCTDEEHYFVCSICERRTPSCRGTDERYLDLCDDCVTAEERMAQ